VNEKQGTVDIYEYIWRPREKRGRLRKAGTTSYGEGVGGNYDQVEPSNPGKVRRPAGPTEETTAAREHRAPSTAVITHVPTNCRWKCKLYTE
jgi:hypothetical protein